MGYLLYGTSTDWHRNKVPGLSPWEFTDIEKHYPTIWFLNEFFGPVDMILRSFQWKFEISTYPPMGKVISCCLHIVNHGIILCFR